MDLTTPEGLTGETTSTGVVSISWGGTGRGLFTTHSGRLRTREGLVDAIATSASKDWWAIDVPFGWPNLWAAFLDQHSRGPTALPDESAIPDRPWETVARRVTDRVQQDSLSLESLADLSERRDIVSP